MRKVWIYSVLVGALAIALGAGSWATAGGGKKNVDADLDGTSEPPVVSSTGTGTLEATIDDDADTISYTLSYAGLEGTTTLFAHIHLGQRSVNGGVSAFLCGGGDKPPCTPTSGTISGVIDPLDVIGPTGQGLAPGEFDELVQAIRAGDTYANVHTNKHPGGEVRGQINDAAGSDD